MKRILCLLAGLTALNLSAPAQQPTPSVALPGIRAIRPAQPPGLPPALTVSVDPTTGLPVTTAAPGLPKFDLDFPGGTPGELAELIKSVLKKSTGNPDQPFNAIVPDEFNDVRLPALKMKNVDVSQLFQALEATSRRSEAQVTGYSSFGGRSSPSYTIANTAYGFKTQGKPTEDSIWYFQVEKPVMPPTPPPPEPPASPEKVCRFYSLTPYLERGLKVDDITTAIETGWKMLGVAGAAQISFHKDTKLLIAVGTTANLETIDAALRALQLTPTPIPAMAPGSFSDRLRTIMAQPGSPVPVAPTPPMTPPAPPAPAPRAAEKAQ